MGEIIVDDQQIRIRSYIEEIDKARVEELERKCEVGPSNRIFLFTDTMGDPICRIRNSPMYKMLVAEASNLELVGVIQGTIKNATIQKLSKELAKVGYILGLRVSPLQRRKGIGSSLVYGLEQWFTDNQVDYSYMATEKENLASVNLFIDKFCYVVFRSPSILVNPVNRNATLSTKSKKIEITKLKIEQAEFMYRKLMGSFEFFPQDIDKILKNKLSLGTWVAYPREDSWVDPLLFGSSECRVPTSWAMISVWNSGDVFKLRLGRAPLSCMFFSKGSRFIEKWLPLPCVKFTTCMPDFFDPFGFYFVFGVHREGPFSGRLVRSLCKFVQNMAWSNKDCKVIVTEVGGHDEELIVNIPHWKLLSCPEDLWCIKAFKNQNHDQEDKTTSTTLDELTKTTPTQALFVDPREV